VSFWKLFGKTLEISGRVMQAEGVDKWIESQGEKLAEDFAVKRGGKALGGRALKKSVLGEFKKPFDDRSFAERIDSTSGQFLNIAGDVCDLIVYSTDISRGSSIPSFLSHDSNAVEYNAD
jgi:hypothetical protein